MNIFKLEKVMDRLDKMMDNAIDGKDIEAGFDETKMSALETKLAQFLAINDTRKAQLDEEKLRISRLISDISHQTKTPIANILLYSQLLVEGNLLPSEKACANSIVLQTEKLDFLIFTLFKTSQLENGLISVNPTLQPIWPMIEELILQVKPKADAKNIKITFTKTCEVAVLDYKWTTEALFNIIDNAIKYTSEGGNITIKITAYQFFCKIDIVDTGIGICEKEIAQIFARFYRSPAVADSEGVGIGLYIAREIVQNEGGYIKVKSKQGSGSVFSVYLRTKI